MYLTKYLTAKGDNEALIQHTEVSEKDHTFEKLIVEEDYITRRRRERAAAAAGLTTTTDEPDWKSSLRSRSVQVSY